MAETRRGFLKTIAGIGGILAGSKIVGHTPEVAASAPVAPESVNLVAQQRTYSSVATMSFYASFCPVIVPVTRFIDRDRLLHGKPF